MGHWWVSDLLSAQGGQAILVAWVFWVITSITLHELSHGWMAIRCGDDTPIYSGHMTWNPLVHMGPTSLIMFLLVGIAWGAMPVDPSRLRKTRHEAYVAFAGPAMNLLLFALCVVLCALATRLKISAGLQGGSVDAYRKTHMFFYYGAILNLVLAAFNMLPVPPLDGWRVLSTLVPAYRRLFDSEQVVIVAMILFAVLFFQGSSLIMSMAHDVVGPTEDVLVRLMGGGPPPP